MLVERFFNIVVGTLQYCGVLQYLGFTILWSVITRYCGVITSSLWGLTNYSVGFHNIVGFTILWGLQYCGVYNIVGFTILWGLQYCGVYNIVGFTILWGLQYCGVYRALHFNDRPFENSENENEKMKMKICKFVTIGLSGA